MSKFVKYPGVTKYNNPAPESVEEATEEGKKILRIITEEIETTSLDEILGIKNKIEAFNKKETCMLFSSDVLAILLSRIDSKKMADIFEKKDYAAIIAKVSEEDEEEIPGLAIAILAKVSYLTKIGIKLNLKEIFGYALKLRTNGEYDVYDLFAETGDGDKPTVSVISLKEIIEAGMSGDDIFDEICLSRNNQNDLLDMFAEPFFEKFISTIILNSEDPEFIAEAFGNELLWNDIVIPHAEDFKKAGFNPEEIEEKDTYLEEYNDEESSEDDHDSGTEYYDDKELDDFDADDYESFFEVDS